MSNTSSIVRKLALVILVIFLVITGFFALGALFTQGIAGGGPPTQKDQLQGLAFINIALGWYAFWLITKNKWYGYLILVFYSAFYYFSVHHSTVSFY